MAEMLPNAVNPQDWQDGPADAPVTLLEYGDFQCGDCREAFHVLQPLRTKFAGQLRFVFRHLPLTDIHPQALEAARAAEAAGSMGKFWDMHDALLQGPAYLTSETIQQAALQIGLSGDEFAARAADEETYKAVKADVDNIRATGLHTTPTFYLNNARYEGALTATALTAAIEAALAQNTP